MKLTINVMDSLGAVPGIRGFSSATYPTSNLALLMPVRIVAPCIVKQLFVGNGATASGNVDVGLYTKDGTLLVSSGSTAQSGTSTIQAFDVTDTLIHRGVYYVAIAMDNTTGTTHRANLSAQFAKYCGLAQAASSFPLPATLTMATCDGYLPMVGLTMEPVV